MFDHFATLWNKGLISGSPSTNTTKVNQFFIVVSRSSMKKWDVVIISYLLKYYNVDCEGNNKLTLEKRNQQKMFGTKIIIFS